MEPTPANAAVRRILLLDDDPIFCSLLEHTAQTRGVLLHYYTSLLEIGHMAQSVTYDVVIVDYDMGQITGPESVEYLSSLFGNIPIVLVSGLPESSIGPLLASSPIGRFVQKSRGAAEIIAVAKELCGTIEDAANRQASFVSPFEGYI